MNKAFLITISALFFATSCVQINPLPVWSGDTKAPIKEAEPLPITDKDHVLLVVGQKLPLDAKFGEEKVTSMLVALQCGEPNFSHLGVAFKTAEPQGFLKFPRGSNHMAADDEGHAYRFWNIPIDSSEFEDCKEKHFSMFISVVQSGDTWAGKYRTIGMGDVQVLPIGMGREFDGSYFRADKSGIYYLGDVHISGGAQVETVNHKTGSGNIGFKVQFETDSEKFSEFLKQSYGKETDFNDLSDKWQVLQKDRILPFLEGELSL